MSLLRCRVRFILVATTLLLGLASASCKGGIIRACDEQALARASDALARAEIDEHEAVVRLSQACPSMPPTLEEQLGTTYAAGLPSEEQRTITLGEGWPYTRLRDRTCANSRRWREQVKGPEPASAQTMFEVCELGRYGLLEPGEAFLFEDLPAFFLAEYLRDARVDAGVARALVRALMTAARHGEQATRRCRLNAGSGACLEIARAEGLTLPESKVWVSLTDASAMTLSLEGIALDDGPVASLDSGRFSASDLDGSLVRPLHARLEALATSERAAAWAAGEDWAARMLVRAGLRAALLCAAALEDG